MNNLIIKLGKYVTSIKAIDSLNPKNIIIQYLSNLNVCLFHRFYDKRDAEDALDAMDGRLLDGRELRVQMARYGRPTSPHRSRGSRRRGRYIFQFVQFVFFCCSYYTQRNINLLLRKTIT